MHKVCVVDTLPDYANSRKLLAFECRALGLKRLRHELQNMAIYLSVCLSVRP